jgi:hypothetical protein
VRRLSGQAFERRHPYGKNREVFGVKPKSLPLDGGGLPASGGAEGDQG